MANVQNIEQSYNQDIQRINEYKIKYQNQINTINQKYSNTALRESIRRRCVIAGQESNSQSQVDQQNERISNEELQNDPTYNKACTDEERAIVIILQEDLILYSQPVQQSLERSTTSIIMSFLSKIVKLGCTLSFGYYCLKYGQKLVAQLSTKNLVGLAIAIVCVGGAALIYYKINPLTAIVNFIC